MKHILFIDTSNANETRVALEKDGKRKELVKKQAHQAAENVLPLIESLLTSEHCSFSDIEDIQVATGPGSYTGIRVGVAVASTLGLVLSIPVNGKKGGEIPLTYEKDPWI